MFTRILSMQVLFIGLAATCCYAQQIKAKPGDTIEAEARGKQDDVTVKCSGKLTAKWPTIMTPDGPCFSYHVAHRGLILFGELLKNEDSISYVVAGPSPDGKTDCARAKVVGHVKGDLDNVKAIDRTSSKTLVNGDEKDQHRGEPPQL